jgi:glutathionylspermidine synthase
VTREIPYPSFAARLTATGMISDPWFEGAPRFRPEPVVLAPEEHQELCHVAEQIATAYDEACKACAADASLVSAFLGLTPVRQALWCASAPHWHGIARADLFLTARGPVVCELNCDTPSGEAEAVLLNRAAAAPGFNDPNAGLAARFCALIELCGRAVTRAPLSIGIIYPTEITEDLSMVLLYRQWFEERGFRVTLGSPFNLCALPGGRAGLFGVACDVFVRHYKTDWWSERRSVWADAEEVPDPEPLSEPLAIILGSVLRGTSAVVNPFGAVVPQNKRAMALFWERLDLFSQASRDAIRRYLPETVRLETLPRRRLVAERPSWVIKSDYGCEGDEVIVGADTDPATWEECLDAAVEGRWIAQRHFGAAGANHGVYLVGGRASGLYTRLSQGPTDRYALSAPVLVREDR